MVDAAVCGTCGATATLQCTGEYGRKGCHRRMCAGCLSRNFSFSVCIKCREGVCVGHSVICVGCGAWYCLTCHLIQICDFCPACHQPMCYDCASDGRTCVCKRAPAAATTRSVWASLRRRSCQRAAAAVTEPLQMKPPRTLASEYQCHHASQWVAPRFDSGELFEY